MSDEAEVSPVKEEVEISKLNEELRTLRQQRFLAILGVIGAMIAFIISNTEKISDIIYHKPKVQVTTEDEYIRKNAQLTISTRGENVLVVVSDSLPITPKWFSVEPGAYRLTVAVFSETVYERDFTVEKGDIRSFVIPHMAGASIRVSVDNRSGHIGPGTQLEFQVEASGNGYVWIFEKRPQGLELIYPVDCLSNCDNEVSVNNGLHLPDQKQRAIFAGSQIGEERLFFFVTSSNDSDLAKRLAGQFEKASIQKASSGIAKDNWGYTEVSYRISEQ